MRARVKLVDTGISFNFILTDRQFSLCLLLPPRKRLLTRQKLRATNVRGRRPSVGTWMNFITLLSVAAARIFCSSKSFISLEIYSRAKERRGGDHKLKKESSYGSFWGAQENFHLK